MPNTFCLWGGGGQGNSESLESQKLRESRLLKHTNYQYIDFEQISGPIKRSRRYFAFLDRSKAELRRQLKSIVSRDFDVLRRPFFYQSKALTLSFRLVKEWASEDIYISRSGRFEFLTFWSLFGLPKVRKVTEKCTKVTEKGPKVTEKTFLKFMNLHFLPACVRTSINRMIYPLY